MFFVGCLLTKILHAESLPISVLLEFHSDITLSCTTLRFSKSNEVATVSNFAMSQSKIVNCQRSPNAIVGFKLRLGIKILDGDNLKILEEELKKYVEDNPRIWDSMLFLRKDHIGGVNETLGVDPLDADYRFVIVSVCFQHRLSWQFTMRIMLHRGELFHHIYKICHDLDVQYDLAEPRQIVTTTTTTGMHRSTTSNTIGTHNELPLPGDIGGVPVL